MSTVTIRGEEYRILERRRITGTGARFDGRVKFVLYRPADGALFAWLGSRSSKSVPANARLVESKV